MAENPFAFDRKSAQRIVKAVKAYEAGNATGAQRGGVITANQCITARLLSQSGDHYSWQQVRRKPTGWEVIPSGLTGTLTERSAYQLDETDTSDLTNKVVTLVRVGGKDADDKITQVWVIVGTASLPTGEFKDMGYIMTSNNQSGWKFPTLHGRLS